MDFCDKEVFHRIQEFGRGNNYFQTHCGIRIPVVNETCCRGEMPLDPKIHFNPNGTVHGGALYTIADSVGGAAALAWGLAATGKSMDELRVVTVNGNLNYLRPARGTCIYAEARYRKMGRTMAVIDLSLTDDQDEEVCSGTFTFMYVQFQRYKTK